MTKLSIIFSNSKSSFVLGLYCIFFLIQYLRKKRFTLLCMTVGLFIYVILSVTIFLGEKGYNLISLSILGILVVIASSKELIQMEKEGKTVAYLFGFDLYDYMIAGVLFIAWIIISRLLT